MEKSIVLVNAVKELKEQFPNLDDFDIHEGLYWYCSDWHGGQSCPLYEILSCSPFQPSCLARGPESEDAEEVYNWLQDRARVWDFVFGRKYRD